MSNKIVISFDFELGWGVLENNLWKYREYQGIYTQMRHDIPTLLSKLSALEIPTTWAMVSNMLVENEGDLNLDHLPDNYKNETIDFFRSAALDSRFGTDLIEQVLKLSDVCEIASHSASHIYAAHPSVTSEQYVEDILQSLRALDNLTGKKIKSLIFPRDQSDHRLKIAKARQNITMRLNPDFVTGSSRGKARRIINGAGAFIKSIPESHITVGGYCETYQLGSLNFNAVGGKYKSIKTILLKQKIKTLLRMLRIKDSSAVYHIWLHPFNISESSINKTLFLNFIEQLSNLRDEDCLEIVTMSNLVGSI